MSASMSLRFPFHCLSFPADTEVILETLNITNKYDLSCMTLGELKDAVRQVISLIRDIAALSLSEIHGIVTMVFQDAFVLPEGLSITREDEYMHFVLTPKMPIYPDREETYKILSFRINKRRSYYCGGPYYLMTGITMKALLMPPDLELNSLEYYLQKERLLDEIRLYEENLVKYKLLLHETASNLETSRALLARLDDVAG